MSVQDAASDRVTIQDAKDTIAFILTQRKGPEAAISSKELANRTPLKATTVRDLIPQIIEEYKIPIASSPDGYYRIADDEQFIKEMERYESQRQSARNRMRWLAQAFYGEREVYL